jgi:hypothetical protein
MRRRALRGGARVRGLLNKSLRLSCRPLNNSGDTMITSKATACEQHEKDRVDVNIRG